MLLATVIRFSEGLSLQECQGYGTPPLLVLCISKLYWRVAAAEPYWAHEQLAALVDIGNSLFFAPFVSFSS